ncbi:FAD-binding oxidoreductase [Gordonia rubripertincta]|uniref:FAD-binding oxidoreductase n=1 Tax=Gordonia rubripertincta TaxID=36822 RepID=A0ABT4MY65_GORRU|nr:FAD-binding oxidoreductase [Gordonia rubripertincta]MCZ4551959.1 FAD-binding oxidoreductase [Gordonia rubripertincta]
MTISPPTPHSTNADPTAELQAAVAGLVTRPGEPGSERAIPFNIAVPVDPCAIVFPESAADVAATLRIAERHGLTVGVQSTGHGALPIDKSTILVHTAGLGGLDIDVAARTARVGAGVRWQQVIDAAAPHGLAALAGSAPGVGVIGFLTGGGIGPLVRSVGLSSDHVRSFELVTGQGEILLVSPENHAELFWGLRGGKGTLGIVTSVEIDLLPISEIYGGAIYFDGSDAPAVLRAWREWSVDLPEHATTSIAFLQLPPLPAVPPPLAGKLTFAVRYASLAEHADAEALIAPIRAVAEPLIDIVGPMPYAALGAIHADPVDPMPVHEDSTLLGEFGDEAVEALIALAGPNAQSPQVVVEVRLLGGAMSRPAAQRSAFCHRGAAYNLTTIGVLAPPIAEHVAPHAAAIMDSVAPWSMGQLPNFSPGSDPARLARCYDEDTLAWLSALADQHDPAGVLRVGQVVRAISPA